MTIQNNMTVGDVAANLPGALAVFQELKIDFCCGGKTPMAEALTASGMTLDEFVARAAKKTEARRENAASPDFAHMKPGALADYIEDTHHEYLRHALPEIDELLVVVLGAHGTNHPELFNLYKLFGNLKAELTQHLVKEEVLLFPALSKGVEPAAGLAAEIVAEHEGAGAILESMRSVSRDYAPPEDACMTYRRVYELLPALEADLHQHIHLENNILLRGVNA